MRIANLLLLIIFSILHIFAFATDFGEYDDLFNVQKHSSIKELSTPTIPIKGDYDTTYIAAPDSTYGTYIDEIDKLIRSRLSESSAFQYLPLQACY
ncbi:MAG: hypothetical protein HQK50_11380 [Oligoflexia bacterium]|nr:hypothetical protein [Oligoflexia bacterium]